MRFFFIGPRALIAGPEKEKIKCVLSYKAGKKTVFFSLVHVCRLLLLKKRDLNAFCSIRR